jgi:hypothetical protein
VGGIINGRKLEWKTQISFGVDASLCMVSIQYIDSAPTTDELQIVLCMHTQTLILGLAFETQNQFSESLSE